MFEINPLLDQEELQAARRERRLGLGRRPQGRPARKNLSDEEYRIGGYNFLGAPFGNIVNTFYGPPRTWQPERELPVRLSGGEETAMGAYDVPRPLVPGLIAQHGH